MLYPDMPSVYDTLAAFLRHTLIQNRTLSPDVDAYVDTVALRDVVATAPADIQRYIELRFIKKLPVSRTLAAMQCGNSEGLMLERRFVLYLTHAEFVDYYIRDRSGAVRPSERTRLLEHARVMVRVLTAVKNGDLAPEDLELREATPQETQYAPRVTYIEHVTLSTRTYNSLSRQGVVSLEALCQHGIQKVATFHGIGATGIDELRTACAAHGIPFEFEGRDVPETTPRRQSVANIETMLAAYQDGDRTNVTVVTYPVEKGVTP